MAPDTGKRRRHHAVSYKEPSSDDDFSDLSGLDRPARPKRAAPERRSTRRRASAESPLASPKPSDAGHSQRLRGKQRVSYHESDTEEEDPDADFEASGPSPPPKRQRTEATRPARRQASSKPKARRFRPLGAPLKSAAATRESTPLPRNFRSDGKIPAWSTLPYHVLLQVFVYASHPLHDDNLTPTSSIAWLARTARICSTFTKPALTALYRNPPLFAVRQNRKQLVQRLITPSSESHEDYQVMVKRLELDATRMTKLTDPQSSVNDLVALISSLKTLKDIDIFDPFDRPPYRERTRRTRRWHYPDELFDALRQTELRLKNWRWNDSYLAKDLMWMKEIHVIDAFQSLREVSLTKFHHDSSKKLMEGAPTKEELLGSALAVLQNLRSLTFETCSVINGRLLPLLPTNLVSLNLTNCRDLNAEALQPFLLTHGSQLEELVLNHNQCLDLSFLIDLKQSCPRLEIFRMDMHYYNTLSTSTDNEPLYDELFPEGETPTWPRTLRVIDLEFLRKWTSTAAVAFFTSLISSADELPWLREIIITAIVDIDWRQRAAFRRKWTATFLEVFERRSASPDPNLASLRSFREWKTSQHEIDDTDKNDSLIQESPRETQKRQDVVEDDSDSDVPLVPSRKRQDDERWDSKRLRSRARSAHYDESSIDDDADSSDDVDKDEDDKVEFIQGMCNTVIFKIDNSRPQEQIFAEEDFLDEEASGDEDWDGNDIVDEGYAW